ncbi:MAG: porin [Allorhizobium sp.]
MNIKSLLLGSAAALAVVSGAQAADAIVAAEPEPMEYVRVCDAFGTGYFYIPGTETCLKISGEVRATLEFGDRYAPVGDDWDSTVRARVNFEAKNDSELGTIGSFIRLQGFDDAGVEIEQAYITVGGFKVGYAATFWDDLGIAGETDRFADVTVFNTISYTYAADAFTFGVGVDDVSEFTSTNDVGVQAMLSASLGAATVGVYGVYETFNDEGAVYGVVSADVGPGTLQVAGLWASGVTGYVDAVPFSGGDSIEWTVAAAYAFKATDKLTITPSVAYWEGLAGTEAWGAGLMGEYALATGLKASATVDYVDVDGAGDDWSGFMRLTRSF